jgi:hypothetical protein
MVVDMDLEDNSIPLLPNHSTPPQHCAASAPPLGLFAMDSYTTFRTLFFDSSPQNILEKFSGLGFKS